MKHNILTSTILLCMLPFAIHAQEKETLKIEASNDTYVYGGVITDHTPGRLKSAPFPVGAAVSIDNLKNNSKYREAIAREYTSITAENAMKMGSIWQSRERYNFRDVDYLVDFAEQNQLRVHGHCLVWYKKSSTSMPQFVQDLHNSGWGTKEEWKQLMKDYIQTVVGRYKGRVASWDVVNESIKDDGTERSEDIWREHIGYPEYIDWAFQCAHEADPDALLFYNDYGYDYAAAKRTKTDELIRGMLDRGIPIHGYGIQAHIDLPNRSEGKFKAAIDQAKRLGIMIHISEIDIKCNPDEDASVTYTEDLQKKQAGLYNEVCASMMNVSESKRFGITQWNVSDASSGLSKNPDWPYLLGSNYEPKTPAYDYFVKGFSGVYIPWNQVIINP
ncbi:MAG: endo-1,4-beta-xylanase [Dysgonomonas sp.]